MRAAATQLALERLARLTPPLPLTNRFVALPWNAPPSAVRRAWPFDDWPFADGVRLVSSVFSDAVLDDLDLLRGDALVVDLVAADQRLAAAVAARSDRR